MLKSRICFYYPLCFMIFLGCAPKYPVQQREIQILEKFLTELKKLSHSELSESEKKFRRNAILTAVESSQEAMEREFSKHPSVEYAITCFNLFEKHKLFSKAKRWLVLSVKADAYKAQTIVDLLKTENKQRKWCVIDAMGEMGDVAFVEPLIKIAEHAVSEEVLVFAIEALGKIGDKRAMALLKKRYTDPIWGIRVSAGEALEKITGEPHPVDLPYEKN